MNQNSAVDYAAGHKKEGLVNVISYKVLLIGDACVGKTSITRQYCDGIFLASTIETLGKEKNKIECSSFIFHHSSLGFANLFSSIVYNLLELQQQQQQNSSFLIFFAVEQRVNKNKSLLMR